MNRQHGFQRMEARAVSLLKNGDQLDPATLIQLIHEVNPSGRELPSDAATRRYQLKSRLQSLLIRRFKDDLRLEIESPEVVGLRYGTQGRDACHAAVAELDEDARAWVRWMIDLVDSDSAAQGKVTSDLRGRRLASSAAAADLPESLLAEGRRALASYDFEAAKTSFVAAVNAAPNGSASERASAAALIELLVDQLGSYAEALECAETISDQALDTPEIRSALGFAASQRGDPDLAERYLDGIGGKRAADAFIALARSALAAESWEQVGRYSRLAAESDPSHPESRTLAEEVARLRAEKRRPLELELERTVAAGDAAAAQDFAQKLLKLWPDSEMAGRVLRQLEARRRQTAARALAEQAEGAMLVGEYARAARLWGDAQLLGEARFEQSVASALQKEREVQQRRAMEATLEALKLSRDDAALQLYCELPAHLRTQVGVQCQFPELGWLESLQPEDPKQLKAAIAAVIELQRVLQFPRTDDELIEALQPHEKTLSPLSLAREVLAEARTRLGARRQARAEEALHSASDALAAGDFSAVLKWLSPSALREFPSKAREQAERLVHHAERAENRAQQLRQFESLLASESYLDALAAANRALDLNEPEEKAAWLERRQRAAVHLRKRVRARAVTCSASFLPEFVGEYRHHEEVLCCLSSDGKRGYLTSTHIGEVFVRVYSLEEQRISMCVTLRAPEPFEMVDAFVDEQSLWMVGERGAVLELSLHTWDLLRWVPDGKARADEIVEDALVVPGSRFLWLGLSSKENRQEYIRVYDLARDRLHRDFLKGFLYGLVPGSTPQVHANCLPDHGRLYLANGAPLHTIPSRVHKVSTWPGGEGLLALFSEEDEAELQVARLSPSGQPLDAAPVANSWSEYLHTMATSRQAQLAFVLHSVDGLPELAAFQVQGDSLTLSYTVKLPPRSYLMQDIAANSVALLVSTSEGLSLQLLDRRAPILAASPAAEEPLRIPSLSIEYFTCGILPSSEQGKQLALEVRSKLSDKARAQFIEETLPALVYDEETLLSAAAWLERFGLQGAHLSVLSYVLEHDRSSRLTRAFQAELSAKQGEWAKVLDHLQRDFAGWDERRLCHVHHLRGLALYHLGRVDEAREEVERGSQLGNDECRLKGWVEMLSALAEPEQTGTAPNRGFRRLVDAVRLADACLDAGDAPGAWNSLDIPAAWNALEIQTMGRLALAAMLSQRAEGLIAFRMRLAVAFFLEMSQDRDLFAGLPPTRLVWNEEKLNDLARLARQWLDAEST